MKCIFLYNAKNKKYRIMRVKKQEENVEIMKNSNNAKTQEMQKIQETLNKNKENLIKQLADIKSIIFEIKQEIQRENEPTKSKISIKQNPKKNIEKAQDKELLDAKKSNFDFEDIVNSNKFKENIYKIATLILVF